jgi:hypothetical protein
LKAVGEEVSPLCAQPTRLAALTLDAAAAREQATMGARPTTAKRLMVEA